MCNLKTICATAVTAVQCTDISVWDALCSVCRAAIAAGYFQIAPGRVIPCPRGTWRAASGPLDPSTNCTSCVGVGVTTPGDAAISEKNCSGVFDCACFGLCRTAQDPEASGGFKK